MFTRTRYAIATWQDARCGRSDNLDQYTPVWWPRLVLRVIVVALWAYGMIGSLI